MLILEVWIWHSDGKRKEVVKYGISEDEEDHK